jgi:hypothetical protein
MGLCLPDTCHQSLDTLYVVKRICKFRLRVPQALDALAEQEVCRSIKSISEHDVLEVDFLVAAELLQ